jgi:uncharacterized phage protein (TIGR02218 family)
MKTASTALLSHFGQETTTIAYLWHVVLKSGTVFGFTDHDSDITYNGVTYLASSGFTSSDIETTAALNVDNLEAQGMLSSPAITEADLIAGLWDDAQIQVMAVNYQDLTQGAMSVRNGVLGNVNTKRSLFVAELRGMTQPLQQNILEYYTASCRAKLGDARCKVVLTPFIFNGSVTTAISVKAWDDTTLTQTNSTTQKTITGITQATSAQVTCPAHGFSSGQQVAISGVVGMTQINGKTFQVTYVDVNNFTINCDTSVAGGLYSAYASGGIATLMPQSEYFQGGIVQWTSGLNLGLQMEVKLYNIGYVELFQPAPYQVSVGDTYTIQAGCDKQLQTCISRFNNVINFRGEPFIPGSDSLMAHG